MVSHIQTIYIPWKSETIKRMVHRNCWVQITAHIVVFRKNPLIHAQLGPTILSYTIYSINIWFSVRKKNTQFCETLLWYTDHPCYAYIYLVHVYGFQKTNEYIPCTNMYPMFVFPLFFLMFCFQQTTKLPWGTYNKKYQPTKTEKIFGNSPNNMFVGWTGGCLQGMIFSGSTVCWGSSQPSLNPFGST